MTALRADPVRLESANDVIANLEADVSLDIDGDVVYDEQSFPVAELAVALDRWMQESPADRADFEFDSMSAEEPGIVWIRRAGLGWRVGSIDQERPALRVFDIAEIDNFIREFIVELTRHALETFDSEVFGYLKSALGSDL